MWTQAIFREVAHDATRGNSKTRIKPNGSLHWFDLGTPTAGVCCEDHGKKAAEALWTLAAPISHAGLKARTSE